MSRFESTRPESLTPGAQQPNWATCEARRCGFRARPDAAYGSQRSLNAARREVAAPFPRSARRSDGQGLATRWTWKSATNGRIGFLSAHLLRLPSPTSRITTAKTAESPSSGPDDRHGSESRPCWPPQISRKLNKMAQVTVPGLGAGRLGSAACHVGERDLEFSPSCRQATAPLAGPAQARSAAARWGCRRGRGSC